MNTMLKSLNFFFLGMNSYRSRKMLWKDGGHLRPVKELWPVSRISPLPG